MSTVEERLAATSSSISQLHEKVSKSRTSIRPTPRANSANNISATVAPAVGYIHSKLSNIAKSAPILSKLVSNPHKDKENTGPDKLHLHSLDTLEEMQERVAKLNKSFVEKQRDVMDQQSEVMHAQALRRMEDWQSLQVKQFEFQNAQAERLRQSMMHTLTSNATSMEPSVPLFSTAPVHHEVPRKQQVHQSEHHSEHQLVHVTAMPDSESLAHFEAKVSAFLGGRFDYNSAFLLVDDLKSQREKLAKSIAKSKAELASKPTVSHDESLRDISLENFMSDERLDKVVNRNTTVKTREAVKTSTYVRQAPTAVTRQPPRAQPPVAQSSRSRAPIKNPVTEEPSRNRSSSPLKQSLPRFYTVRLADKPIFLRRTTVKPPSLTSARPIATREPSRSRSPTRKEVKIISRSVSPQKVVSEPEPPIIREVQKSMSEGGTQTLPLAISVATQASPLPRTRAATVILVYNHSKLMYSHSQYRNKNLRFQNQFGNKIVVLIVVCWSGCKMRFWSKCWPARNPHSKTSHLQSLIYHDYAITLT